MNAPGSNCHSSILLKKSFLFTDHQMTTTTSITKMLIRTTHESKIISCQFIFVSSGRGECYYLLIHITHVSLGSHSSRCFLRKLCFFNVTSSVLLSYLAAFTCLAYHHPKNVENKRRSSYTWTLSVWRSCLPLGQLLFTYNIVVHCASTFNVYGTCVPVGVFVQSAHITHMNKSGYIYSFLL